MQAMSCKCWWSKVGAPHLEVVVLLHLRAVLLQHREQLGNFDGNDDDDDDGDGYDVEFSSNTVSSWRKLMVMTIIMIPTCLSLS